MNRIYDSLRQCALFRDIPDERLKKDIMPYGKLQDYPKNKYLITYQQRIETFAVVVSGRIQTQHIFTDGTYSILDVMEKSETVGADLLWTSSRVSPYYAVAAVQSQVLLFPVSMITERGKISEDCRQLIMGKLLLLISQENMRKQYRLAILSQKGLRERVMTYLTMQSVKRNSPTFEIPFSREELASYLCVNRTALSHELSRMRKEGLIDFRMKEFTLLKHADAEIEPIE